MSFLPPFIIGGPGGGEGGKSKFSAFQEFLWCFEGGSGSSTLTPEEDDTGHDKSS